MTCSTLYGTLVPSRGDLSVGKQGLPYFEGIAAQTVGAKAICMHLLSIPPGTCGRVHLHDAHESAIYQLTGETEAWHGPELERHTVVKAGDLFYIPAGVPHLPVNLTDRTVQVLVARTDPNEQESVHLLPELEALAAQRLAARKGDI